MSETPPPSGGLFAELRRRRVFRVAAVYGVGAWAVIQGTATLVQMLELPAVVGKIVVGAVVGGFPIALLISWLFDWTPEGVRRTDPSATAPPARARISRPAVALSLVILAAVGSGFWYVRGPANDSFDAEEQAADAIAVLPFSVQGPPDIEYLGEGIVSLLGTKLNGTLELRSVDAQTLLKAVARENADDFDLARARALALRFGARQFITGNILQVGQKLQIDARLWRSDSMNAPVEEASVMGDAADVFVMVDDLAGELLTAQLRTAGARLVRTAAVTTGSLDALKAYLEGEAAYRRAELAEAAEHLQRAVELDSTFAMAHLRLATVAAWTASGRLEGSTAAAEAAVRHGARLPPRERGLAAAYLAFVREDTAAIGMYRSLAARYPDDAEVVSQVGEALYHANPRLGRPPDQSVPYFRRAVALDPGNVSYGLHLVTMYFNQGCWACLDSLHTLYGAWLAGDSTTGLIQALARGERVSGWAARMSRWTPRMLHKLGAAAIASGDARLVDLYAPALKAQLSTWPEDSLGWVGPVVGSAHATALGLSGTARELGRLAAAERPEQYSAARASYAAIPGVPQSGGELAEAARALEAVDTGAIPLRESPSAPIPDGTFPLTREYLLGVLALRGGDARTAGAHAGALERSTGPDSLRALASVYASSLRADIALRAGRPDDALRILDSVDRENIMLRFLPVAADRSLLFPAWLDRLLRADALVLLGRHHEALGWLQAFEFERSPYLLPARGPVWLRRGEVHERLGQPQEAVRWYARALALWRHADPGYAPLRGDLEQRLARLAPDG